MIDFNYTAPELLPFRIQEVLDAPNEPHRIGGVVYVPEGGGECVMEYGGDVTEDTARVMGVYFCNECGSPNYNDCMPHYCIYCGKAVKR